VTSRCSQNPKRASWPGPADIPTNRHTTPGTNQGRPAADRGQQPRHRKGETSHDASVLTLRIPITDDAKAPLIETSEATNGSQAIKRLNRQWRGTASRPK
jgi:hypothetical protein